MPTARSVQLTPRQDLLFRGVVSLFIGVIWIGVGYVFFHDWYMHALGGTSETGMRAWRLGLPPLILGGALLWAAREPERRGWLGTRAGLSGVYGAVIAVMFALYMGR